jgi:hypothetical protein
MTSPLHEVCCARLPADQLPALAGIRCAPGVRVALAGASAWVCWEVGDEPVLRRILPVAGVRLYLRREGRWFRHGQHLPDFEVLENLNYRPLHDVLTPAPVRPLPARVPELRPVTLTLADDDHPRRTTAVACNLAALCAWADTVPAARLAGLRAAHCRGRVLVLGQRLPPLPAGERFWGERVLVPLGYRPEPALAEGAICTALGLGEDELLLIRPGNAEVVPGSALRPLTRAGLRLAGREGAP